MRSGQYKLSSKGGSELGKRGAITSGQFKTSYRELPSLSTASQDEQPLQANFINLDSLHLSVLKRVDERDEFKDGVRKKYKEHIYKGNKKRDSILRHKSCENVSVLTRGTVNRVEQKFRSLLRVDSKWSCDNVLPTPGDTPDEIWQAEKSEDMPEDTWQVGKIVTMTKKPRLVSAHSHSALHTLSTSSDSASCLSASSGYSSSSSSSSYGSFKSSESVCSSLPRHRNNSSGSPSPIADNSRMLFADNPLYDVMPASLQIPDPFFCLDTSPYESFPSDEISLKEENTLLTSSSIITDPIAKQCIEYFEKRLSSSETLRKKWSLFICEPPERYNQINSDLISKGDAIIDSKFNAGFDSDMSLGVESNFSLSEEFSEGGDKKTRKKNQLDEKMEILRQEIASLILQDNTLFKQLLTLHESISNLKVQSALKSSHCSFVSSSNNESPSLGSNTPSDLESFTEEEEIEGQIPSTSEINFYNNEESTCTEQNEDNLFLREEEESFSFCEDKPSANTNDDDEDDEGHGTDLSLGETPSNSSSPASTLSSNSSEGISYSRNLYSEMNSDFAASFTRCRKSYAPNARNRRRSSSVNRQKSPSLECGTTTALVVIYADDEELLLNASRPRSHSFTPLTTYAFHDALNYSCVNNNLKTNNERTIETSLLQSLSSKNDKEELDVSSKVTLISCSNENDVSSPICITSRSNHSHPPYREALIM